MRVVIIVTKSRFICHIWFFCHRKPLRSESNFFCVSSDVHVINLHVTFLCFIGYTCHVSVFCQMYMSHLYVSSVVYVMLLCFISSTCHVSVFQQMYMSRFCVSPDDRYRHDATDDAISVRSLVSSCSLAEEVLARARNRRNEFWTRP